MLTREIDRIAVYGKTEGLAVYELIGSAPGTSGGSSRHGSSTTKWVYRNIARATSVPLFAASRLFWASVFTTGPTELMLSRVGSSSNRASTISGRPSWLCNRNNSWSGKAVQTTNSTIPAACAHLTFTEAPRAFALRKLATPSSS